MHAFTRHMLASQGGDDEDDVSVGDEDDYDRASKRRDAEDDGDDSDGDGSQRKSAQKKFAALQQQMLRSGASDAGPSQPEPKAHIAAVNMDELTGGLLDGSVRYWSDFQQVVRCSLRAMLAAATAGCCRRRALVSPHAERIPPAFLLPFEHRSWAQQQQLLRRFRHGVQLTHTHCTIRRACSPYAPPGIASSNRQQLEQVEDSVRTPPLTPFHDI
jgi:hypothetical protein